LLSAADAASTCAEYKQWLAGGGYCPDGERRGTTEGVHGMLTSIE
jgi:hypothetical protein